MSDMSNMNMPSMSAEEFTHHVIASVCDSAEDVAHMLIALDVEYTKYLTEVVGIDVTVYPEITVTILDVEHSSREYPDEFEQRFYTWFQDIHWPATIQRFDAEIEEEAKQEKKTKKIIKEMQQTLKKYKYDRDN